MAYCRQEGKDRIIFVTKEDHETPSNAELVADDPNDPYEEHASSCGNRPVRLLQSPLSPVKCSSKHLVWKGHSQSGSFQQWDPAHPSEPWTGMTGPRMSLFLFWYQGSNSGVLDP
ncbi:mitochondrial intermembrane space import and assembly protein 40 isoform X3 [Ictidomys tridecemlineatus]